MAVVAPTVTDVSPSGDGSAILVVWAAIKSATSDTCAPVSYPKHTNKSVHVSGTFGSGSIGVTGSNNGSSFVALNDMSSTVIAITSEGIKGVLENTLRVTPLLSGGSSASITVSMLFEQPNPART